MYRAFAIFDIIGFTPKVFLYKYSELFLGIIKHSNRELTTSAIII